MPQALLAVSSSTKQLCSQPGTWQNLRQNSVVSSHTICADNCDKSAGTSGPGDSRMCPFLRRAPHAHTTSHLDRACNQQSCLCPDCTDTLLMRLLPSHTVMDTPCIVWLHNCHVYSMPENIHSARSRLTS